MWHMTHVTWLVVNIVSNFQVPSSNGLGFMVLWIFGGKGSLTWLGVSRTAPATPGLLNTLSEQESFSCGAIKTKSFIVLFRQVFWAFQSYWVQPSKIGGKLDRMYLHWTLIQGVRNRPGVARAGLQTGLWLINWLIISSFSLNIFKTLSIPNRKS